MTSYRRYTFHVELPSGGVKYTRMDKMRFSTEFVVYIEHVRERSMVTMDDIVNQSVLVRMTLSDFERRDAR